MAWMPFSFRRTKKTHPKKIFYSLESRKKDGLHTHLHWIADAAAAVCVHLLIDCAEKKLPREIEWENDEEKYKNTFFFTGEGKTDEFKQGPLSQKVNSVVQTVLFSSFYSSSF